MAHKIDRRDFLSLMGLGGAAAVTMSCSDSPNFDETWHPWVEPVEGTIPYLPNFYATTTHESDGLGLRIRTIEGRAQLAHGNPEHPFSYGKADGVGTITARQQSVIEDLYGPGRVRKPRTKDGKEITWRNAKALLEEKINGAKGKGVYALTGAFTGATAEIWTRFVSEMGSGKVVQYKAFSEADMLQASEKVFGKSVVPLVSLKGADAVVSLGAQFLETWGNVTDNSKHYGDMRTVDHGKRGLHIQMEARMSGTGASADEWMAARPGSETMVALGLLKEVSAHAANVDAATKSKVDALTGGITLKDAAGASGLKEADLKHAAEALNKAKSAVVLPAESLSLGKSAVTHYAAVMLLNKVLGGVGKHYNYEAGKTIDRVPGHNDIVEFTKTLGSGSVDLLFIKGTNPTYSLPGSLNFADAVGKAGFTVAFADSINETTALADLIIPVTHDLESWGEHNTYAGVDMLMQPVMRPRWEVKQAEDHLIEWLLAANAEALPQQNFHDYLKASWGARFGADWRGALKKGGNFNIPAGTDLPVSGNLADDFFANVKSDGLNTTALILVDSARFGDGFAANRGWMQELPEMMTNTTWDSWLEMSIKNAADLGVKHGDLVNVTVGGTVEAIPAYPLETISDSVVILATGQGHTGFSEAYNNRGSNAFVYLSGEQGDGGQFYAGPLNATLAKEGGKRKLATPHLPGWGDRAVTPLHTMTGDWDEPHEHYRRNLHQTIAAGALGHGGDHHGGHHFDEPMLEKKSRFPRAKTRLAEEYQGFYPNRDDDKVYVDRDETFYDPYKWEMAVDLNRCTGCGSCVTACYGENNLPVVGRDEVIRGREMAWIRINRYLDFAGGGVSVGMLPMMCQQCGNAPCESVCPSLATYHNKEGLNAMVYNRCVGTRYCSNNCSYKVRRFNWYSFEYPGDMRWQMNPAVSVRQKGVMEKCTFCQQRIREAKSVARDENRLVKDGDVTTACQDACPSQAISFGNVKEKESHVAHAAHDERAYKALDGHIHTKPGVTYLKRVTLDKSGDGGHHG